MVKDTKLYDVLKITPNASCDEIKKAYRTLSLIYHPDKNGTGNDEKFKEISNAYEILSNKDLKNKYDLYGDIKENINVFDINGDNEIDIYVTITLKLRQIYYGCDEIIKYSRYEQCKECESKRIECNICNGFGFISGHIQLFPGIYQQHNEICSSCNGRCFNNDDKEICKYCNNTFKILNKTTYKLKIYKGFETDVQVIINDMGHIANNIKKFGKLIINVNLEKKNNITRNGLDIIIDMEPITLYESLFGFKKDILHLNDELIYFDTKIYDNFNNVINVNRIEQGDKKIIKQKGLIDENDNHGDLILIFNVEYPKYSDIKKYENIMKEIFDYNNSSEISNNAINVKLENFDECYNKFQEEHNINDNCKLS